MKKLLFTVALVVGAFGFESAVQAAPDGSIQSSVAICDPNAPSMCQAFAGGAPATAQITCTTAGTVQVLAAITTAAAGRFVSNTSGATIYLGATGVSSTTGYALPTGTTIDLTKSTSALYCATATSTAVLSTLQY